MKIADAKEVYKEWAEALSQDYEKLIEAHKVDNPEEGLSNNNYLHALFYTDYMFRKTQREIRILSGDDGDGFLGMLKTSFEEALKKIRRKGGFAHLILVERVVSKFLSSMLAKYPNVLDIILVKPLENAKVSHSIICDDNMLRKERPHPPLKNDTDAGEVKARVYFDSKIKTKLAAENFDKTWKFLMGEVNAANSGSGSGPS